MHKIKSTVYILILVALLIGMGFLVRNGSGMSGATTADTIACYEDTDCDDRIEATIDLCLNPGTISSLCVNRPEK